MSTDGSDVNEGCTGDSGDVGVGVEGLSVAVVVDVSISKPNETSFNSISIDLLRKTTGGATFDCRLSREDNDDDDEWDDRRGDVCSEIEDDDGGGSGIGGIAAGISVDTAEGGGGGRETEVVWSSSFVIGIDDLELDVVERLSPFCVGWKRRLSEKRAVRWFVFVWFVSCRRSFIDRRRCVTVTNGSDTISLFELFNVNEDNDNESNSSLFDDVLCHSGRDISPF